MDDLRRALETPYRSAGPEQERVATLRSCGEGAAAGALRGQRAHGGRGVAPVAVRPSVHSGKGGVLALSQHGEGRIGPGHVVVTDR